MSFVIEVKILADVQSMLPEGVIKLCFVVGAQIIDMMMLVIDVTKGMQTQTAECLVIGEITCSKMIVVLNKVDMFDDDKREASVDKVRTRKQSSLQVTIVKSCNVCPQVQIFASFFQIKKRIMKTLENTVFAGVQTVAVAARPGASEVTNNFFPAV
jgi:selenocysteine-specific translation elongation factor